MKLLYNSIIKHLNYRGKMKLQYIKYSGRLDKIRGFGSDRHLQLNCVVSDGEFSGFEVTLKIASQKM